MIRKNHVLVLPALVGAMTMAMPQTASAQNLLEALFGRPKRVVNEFPPPPPPHQPSAPTKAKPAKPVAKIQGPGYATYKPDALVRIDFSKLLTTAAVSDQPTPASFTRQLAELVDVKVMAEKPIATAVVDWYATHTSPLWTADGKANDRAEAAQRVMGEAVSYGLSSEDYAVPPPADSGQDLIRYEIEMTARVLRYIRDAGTGRIAPNRISGYYDFPAKPVDFTGALTAIADGGDVATRLEAAHPSNREYRLLHDELVSMQAQEENAIVVDPKLLLKPGETSPELPKLLTLVARDLDDELGGAYGETLYRLQGSELYSEELTPVFRAIQKRAGLKPDGVIGPRTVQLLAGDSKADRVRKLVVALEQMRWLPNELGETRVFINQPAYTAAYIEDGQEKLNMRTVVGSVTNQTSFFYDQIKQVDYNPYWGVPQSIIVNEMLPRLRNDPGYLDRAGYEVIDSKGKKIPSSSVAWGQYGAKVPYGIRQTPSEANALGELKILFPNKHAIYMHDTPQKALFNRDSRAFSHGCVRLAQPREMAAALLGKPVSYVADKLANGHSTEKVTRTIPVYVAYFTAWPNKDGVIEYFSDVYGRDSRLMDAVKRTDEVREPSV